jgi:hypothetical protein
MTKLLTTADKMRARKIVMAAPSSTVPGNGRVLRQVAINVPEGGLAASTRHY